MRRALLNGGALAAAVATALLAARGAPIEYIVLAAMAMSIIGSFAIVASLAVEVEPGTIVVLVGGRHRGDDKVWRGWRFVRGGRTLRLPAEEIVRVTVTPETREGVIAAIDKAMFEHRPRGRAEPVIRSAADAHLG